METDRYEFSELGKFFKRGLVCAFLAGLMPAQGEPFPINLKKAPQSQEDLLLIEKRLYEVIPHAKSATVCIAIDQGTGSGVIVSADGLVMTAAHVSTGVGNDVTVIMPDGTRLKAETLGLMAESDAALVKIVEPNKDGAPFPFVEINHTDDTKLGDWVFSLGHSGGFNKERGAVARLARLVSVADTTLQSDGTLIGGDSGGPLFDMAGRLIGIHSRVGKQLQMNMHVPIKVFEEGWEGMLKSEFIGEGAFATRPVIGKGIFGAATKPAKGGLEITKIGKKTPAEKAGLKEGDLIRTVNGTTVKDRDELKAILAKLAAGDKLALEITRKGKDETVNLRLGNL